MQEYYIVQMHARVYGHLLGNGIAGDGRAGELRIRGAILRADSPTPAGVAAPGRRAVLLYRQELHTAQSLHRDLRVHQRM